MLDLRQLQSDFVGMIPKIRNKAFRVFRGSRDRETKIADVVSTCWEQYLKLHSEGRGCVAYWTTLADYAIRRVVTISARSTDALRTVHSILTQSEKTTATKRLTTYTPNNIPRRGLKTAAGYGRLIAEQTTSPPA